MKAFTFLATLWLALPLTQVTAQMAHVPGEILVQFKPGINPEHVLNQYRTLRGTDTDIALGEFLSPPMNIYLVKFNGLMVSEDALLKTLRSDRNISIAQFNHYVYERSNVPNDPGFGQQWHHINTGQSGGTADADIDTDLAWEITTGGTTALGDTIVVCVIEGGNLNHPDLAANAWRNYGEIPGNGIDDDANGYVDDYLGWNVGAQNDQGILAGGHGTQVMGMIGAKGDNNLAVVGANWDVKIMSVGGENIFNEASVVSAYSYPLVMRKLYDGSNGGSGAFVVATNASWGIDNGNVNDVPIWAAYYDTLGKYGILSCGATANNNVNIDVVGDIPTAAPSDYMISVTATNRNDVRTFSAYGATTVDFGAPGENVFTTSGSSGSSATSGTSFASPLTAGVIALLYSAPCESFAQFVRDNPQGAADYVRFALFEGVDVVDNLVGQTVTGGRINANNSLMTLMLNCGADLCLPPFAFNYEVEADTIYNFSWNSISEGGVSIRYRISGTEEWTIVNDINTSIFSIDILLYCTAYEFEIGSLCSETGDGIVYGSNTIFTTMACCEAPESIVQGIATNVSLSITWPLSFGIDSYDVYYRPEGTAIWILLGAFENGEANIDGLESCTNYEILVTPTCAEDLDESVTLTVRTKGCGACLDSEYCSNYAEDSFWEFIESVQINGVLFQTGNNGGYAFFENTSIELEAAGNYPLTVTPGFTFGDYGEFIRVWIDFNHDGLYGINEQVLSSTQGSPNPVSGTIAIPENATLGLTRMRVAMKYVGNSSANVGSCEVFQEGETEDYCVTIVESTLSTTSVLNELNKVQVYPNPSEGLVYVKLPEGTTNELFVFRVFDVSGKMVFERNMTQSVNSVSLDLLETGMYIYSLSPASGLNWGAGKLIMSK